MRDIKFRGKRLDNGEWAEGYYIVSTGSDEPDEHIIQAVDRYYEVDTSTVGQYTGLQDKNGVDIYDGDIVKTELLGIVKIGFIVFFAGAFLIQFDDERTMIVGYIQPYYNGIEVIGNIHDNSELIKEA